MRGGFFNGFEIPRSANNYLILHPKGVAQKQHSQFFMAGTARRRQALDFVFTFCFLLPLA
jgi:hypothetical protein